MRGFGLLVLGMVALTSGIRAQTVLRGTVRGGDEPLIGATVRIRGTGHGTLTGSGGEFELTLPPGDTLWVEAAFIGMETQAKLWKGEARLNFLLAERTQDIEAVVVVARANINDVDIRERTGAIERVDIPHLRVKPITNLGLALQGNVPGLAVRNTGELGEKPRVRVRGNSSLRRGDLANEPLYILDGQVVTPETFFNLPAEDIQSIKLLKDAVATALYGIKAANGVLEVSSRRGGRNPGLGRNAVVSYSGRLGVTFPAPRPFEMMGTEQKLELEERLGNLATPGFRYSERGIRHVHGMSQTEEELLEMIRAGRGVLDSLRAFDTDWYSYFLRPRFTHSHTLSLRGGGQQTSIYTSLSYSDQQALLEGNGLQRLGGHLSMDQEIGRRMRLGASLGGGYTNFRTENGSDFSPYEVIYRLNPYETPESASLVSYPNRSFDDLFNQFRQESETGNMNASLHLNYEPIPRLEVGAVAGIDFSSTKTLTITPSSSYSERQSGIPEAERGQLVESKNSVSNLTGNVRITYTLSMGRHELTIGGNADTYTTIIDQLGVRGRGLFNEGESAAGIDNSIEGTNRARVSGRHEKTRNIGVGLLAGYTLGGTYDLFGTYKLDASSVLPERMRFNSAWAVGLGLRLDRLPGLRDLAWLQGMRLRASYGHTANLQGISPYHVVTTFQRMPAGYGSQRGLEVMALPNHELRAEQNHMLDIGLHLNLGITAISLSYYNRRTLDALLDVPIPSSTGFVTQKRNVGSLENQGLDLSLNQTLVRHRDWYAGLRLNLAYNRNRVLDLQHGQRLYTDEQALIPDYEVGQPIDLIYGLHSLGIDPENGIPWFRRHDGTAVDASFGEFSQEDFTVLGHSTPPFHGGMNLSFLWRELSLNVDLYYTFGGKLQRADSQIRDLSHANQNARSSQLESMWFERGDQGRIFPAAWALEQGYQSLAYANQRNVVRSDMIRISSISLHYSLPVARIPGLRRTISRAQIGIEAANLFTLTPFSTGDPETGRVILPLQPILTLSTRISF